MLLAVDTSTRWMGVALYDGDSVLGEMVWQTHNHHTVELAPSIESLLHKCDLRPESLDILAVALGPGSFTSLRIGLALVKGMALGLHLPVVGVPTLDILAAAQPLQEVPLVAVAQVGRGRLAVGWYEVSDGRWVAQGMPELALAEELAAKVNSPATICGEISAANRVTIERLAPQALLVAPAYGLRRPSFLAEIGWERWQAGQIEAIEELSPIYLRVSKDIPD